MPILVATALSTANTTNTTKLVIYIVRLPNVSLKLLHHSGDTLIASMYIATLRFVIVGLVLKACAMGRRAGITMAEPIGAAAADSATENVISHFVLCE
jgi:hypothetical protein